MEDVAPKIIEILKKHMKNPDKAISLETKLEDLEIESLDLAMIVFDIEDSFGIEIPYNGDADDRDRGLLERNAHAPLDDPLKLRDRLVKGLLAEMRFVEDRRNDRYFSHNLPFPNAKKCALSCRKRRTE